VQHHGVGGALHLDRDGDLAGEGRGVQVGFEHQVVAVRADVLGQSV
jgi:hypothetical protein